MKHQAHRNLLAVAFAVLCSVFAIGQVHAATTSSPAVVNGTKWLQAQVQNDGTLLNEALSIATPLQNRAETLETLKTLATVPSPLADQLAADITDNTEYLARRAFTLSLAGRDASAITQQLLAKQNLDGGFGGATGYTSDALDTALVMLAMSQNSLAGTAAAQAARSYLISSIQSDGGVGAGSDSLRINASALALLALQSFPQDLTTATALKQIDSWLLLKQGADGSWLGNSNLTALSLAAISPMLTDPTISTTATTYLTGLQAADGSWGDDPFLTAVVLRALSQPAPSGTTTAANSAITGLVVDSNTTAALAGATVTLSGAATATVTTGTDGKINFANLAAGSYNLQITAAGYNTYTNTYQLNTSQTLNIGTIALTQISTTGIVTGTVTDGATGKALAGATVTVNTATAVTDANGMYKVANVAPGAVTLSASMTGYASVSVTGSVAGGQTLSFSPALYTSGTAAAPTTGVYTGKVVAAGTNLPLAGVSIVLNGTSAGMTAADGSFSLTLAPASYSASFSLAGYNAATASFMLTAGTTVNAGTITLTATPTTGTISGTVTDGATNAPLAGATVSLNGGTTAVTDAKGQYSFANVAPGAVSLSASMTGYGTASGAGSLQAGQTLTFSPALYATGATAPTTGIFTGKVVDASTNLPLAGVSIVLNGTASGTTATDGTFSLTLAPASYNASFTLSGYNSGSGAFLLTAGATVNAGTIALTAVPTTGTISGKVTDAATHLALAGAAVTLNGVTTVATDANGQYSFASVTPGAVTLTASRTGYASAAGTGTVQAGQTLDFSPALGISPTTGTFTGKVVAAGTNLPLAGVSIVLNGAPAGVTAADGSFSLTLAPVSYNAAFTLTGYSSATTSFMLTAGTTVNAGTVTLTPQQATTTISGVVKDATTGNPINGAQVQVLQVLNGGVVTTGADGAYTLTGLNGTTFDLRVSATGYISDSVQLTVTQPMNVTQDFPLQVQTGAGVSLGMVLSNPATAGSQTDIGISAVVANAATGTPTTVVLTLQVVDPTGKVVSSAAPYDKTGTNMLSQIPLAPGQQVPVLFKWNSGQFAPGAYSLVARAVAAGTITGATPLGQVLATSQGALAVTPQQHFNGNVTADPPVLQAGLNTPVQLSAVLANDGNTNLPAQAYQLTITDTATGTVIATQQASGAAFSPNALISLTFANWTPTTPGNFKIDVKAVGAAYLGDAPGKVYVGDAATGTFTVNQLAVPAGTQTVKGNIHVTGQDVTQGTISNPLAPLIKTAVQKAVAYNDATASNWILTNGCSGCHVGAQALVGGEMNIQIAPNYNTSQRNVIFNRLATSQNADGSITPSYYTTSYVQAQTYLSLWGLNSWHAKNDIIGTLVKGANYLINEQKLDSGGSWGTDYPYAWWYSRTINTGLNTKSLVDIATLVKQTPTSALPTVYALTPLVTPGQISGNYKGAAADASGNLYVTTYINGSLVLVKPDGSTKTLLTGLQGPRPPVFGSDGALYIPSDGGVIRYTLAGQKTLLTTTGATNVALGPDGNIYAAAYWTHKIIMITPAGVVSDYYSGPGVSSPHGIGFDQQGTLLVADVAYNYILKINPDKSVVVAVYTGVAPYSILQDGANMLVGTANGVVRYNSSWQGVTLTSTQAWSLARNADGSVMVGSTTYNPDVLYTLNFGPLLTAASFDQPITKAANWLLNSAPTDNDNIEMAFRLIGLGEAAKYFAGTPFAATIQTKMTAIGDLLKSRQLADGGWSRGCGPSLWGAYWCATGSDSMVTAMVGVALDYLNPSPNDPAVVNAIKLLLSRQQADGSWISENGILTTHMAATTWVAIWLPIALDRLGGIDTDMTVSMPANVTLANPSIAPASSTPNAAGGVNYLWHLQGVTSAGRDVGFDLTLSNMVLGESRPVASNAYLTFNNTFTNQPTTAQIAIPRVTASAFLGVGVTTDQVSYPANTPVNITAAVNNTSAVGTLDGSVKLEVYSSDNFLVGVVGTFPFTGLAPGAQTPVSGTWGTAANAAGNYYVLATLYDAQNRFVGTAKSAFGITGDPAGAVPGFTGVGAAISVDKQSYQPVDRVQIANRITDLTQNTAFSGLQAVVTVYRPDGAVLWSQTSALQQLLAASYIDLPESLQLASAPVGQYQVVLSVLNSSGIQVARAAAGFNVLSSALTGAGLKGTLGALPKIVPQTDPVVLNWTAANAGNADFLGLPLTLSIVDPATRQVMARQAYTIDLLQGKTYQTAFSWDTTPATVGASYVAILTASVGGKDIVLAQDGFLVTYPPVKLGVTQSTVRENRVLVWLACNPGEGQGTAEGVGASNGDGGPSSKGDAHRDKADHAEHIPLCLQSRAAFLDNLLTQLKVPHLITTNRTDFRNAFREGKYNVYWLSGDIKLADGKALGNSSGSAASDRGQAKGQGKGLDGAAPAYGRKDRDDLAEEIREAVNRGDGLILDGVKHGGGPLQDAAGLAWSGRLGNGQAGNGQAGDGRLPGAGQQVTTLGSLFAVQTLPAAGLPQQIRITMGRDEADFAPALDDAGDPAPDANGDARQNANADAQHGANRQDSGKAQNAGDKQGSDAATAGDHHAADDAHKPVWPAIVSNLYGRGRTLAFGFDLVDALQNGSAPAAWQAELQTGLGYLLPPLPNPYSGGAWVTLETDIQNQARTVPLGVDTFLPQGSVLLQTVPQAVLDANGQPTWNFTLPEAATQTLLSTLRLPRVTGTHRALTTIDSYLNGAKRRYGEYGYEWTVAAADTLGDKITADLTALTLTSGEEIEARAAAIAKLQRATALIGNAQYGRAIVSLLQAIDQVRQIASVDVSGIRQELDELLQQTEWDWLRTGGAAASPAPFGLDGGDPGHSPDAPGQNAPANAGNSQNGPGNSQGGQGQDHAAQQADAGAHGRKQSGNQ